MNKIEKIIETLKNKEQIVIVSPVNNDFYILRIIAELLFLLTDIENRDYIRHFNNGKKILVAGDIFVFLSWYAAEHSCCMIWENAQNFTEEAWSFTVYRTNELEFKNIFLIDSTDESLLTIPLFIKNSMQFFYFNEEEIKIFLETLSNEALKNRLDKLHNLQLESIYYINKMKKEVK